MNKFRCRVRNHVSWDLILQLGLYWAKFYHNNYNLTKKLTPPCTSIPFRFFLFTVCACAVLHGIIVYIPDKILSADPYVVFCTAFMAFIVIFSLISIGCQPMSDKKPPFKVRTENRKKYLFIVKTQMNCLS